MLASFRLEGAMWDSLGFRESPYNTNPLKPRQEDVELLVGRESEATELCTVLESSSNGILVLSGSPGVGKTSFFNVQQYKLENRLTAFGPKVLAARNLCPVQPEDDVRAIALRALDSLYRSIVTFCNEKHHQVPSETKKIGKWLNGGSSGLEIGVTIAGFGGNVGRTITLPAINEASFESIADAVCALSSEASKSLYFDSTVIALDNIENLDDSTLGNILISFRDTLFSVPHLWWVLVGQSGLGSLIQSLDPRVFERTAGSGIEIKPLELEELHEAISLRVRKFHRSGNGAAPLSKRMHEKLFEASYGEMRFVFKYSNSICAKHVETTRNNVMSIDSVRKMQSKPGFRDGFTKALNSAIAEQMINSHIPDRVADGYLRKIVANELAGYQLKPKEKEVLRIIGERGKARPSDWKEFSFKSMQDFSSNYLSKLYHQNLLVRKQEGRAVNYRLRGIAHIADSCGLLK